jgi:large subunit ribosomal protein L3
MVNKLFGKKLGMTRYFLDEGKSVAVSVLKLGPCVVIQKKTNKKESRVNKPLLGHFKPAGEGRFVHLREIEVEDSDSFELGQEIKSDIFSVGDVVHVSGISKGRGFAGVMKRWGFSGGRKTHGSRSHRVPGSIGCSATPGRVTKGKKLPGRMGYQRVTIKNLKIVDVRPEMDVVLVKGAVPGGPNSPVEVSKV